MTKSSCAICAAVSAISAVSGARSVILASSANSSLAALPSYSEKRWTSSSASNGASIANRGDRNRSLKCLSLPATPTQRTNCPSATQATSPSSAPPAEQKDKAPHQEGSADRCHTPAAGSSVGSRGPHPAPAPRTQSAPPPPATTHKSVFQPLLNLQDHDPTRSLYPSEHSAKTGDNLRSLVPVKQDTASLQRLPRHCGCAKLRFREQKLSILQRHS
jgi:hypothetical protein